MQLNTEERKTEMPFERHALTKNTMNIWYDLYDLTMVNIIDKIITYLSLVITL